MTFNNEYQNILDFMDKVRLFWRIYIMRVKHWDWIQITEKNNLEHEISGDKRATEKMD